MKQILISEANAKEIMEAFDCAWGEGAAGMSDHLIAELYCTYPEVVKAYPYLPEVKKLLGLDKQDSK